MSGILCYKTSPYSYQDEGVRYGMNRDRFFLGDEQGLGKTKQALDIAINNKHYYNYKHCLIVCCVNSLKWNWYNEVLTHTTEQPYILGQKTNKKGVTKIGSVADRKKDLENIDELPYFIITNIETFRDREFADKINELCKDKIQMCVADELHKCGNPSSQMSKGFLQVQCEYRMAMTGTPIMNSPLDMYIILKWLGYEKHSFYQFKNHYCVMGGFGGYQVVGYKHIEQITEMTDKFMLRRLKKDVLDLPEKVYVDEIVEMTNKQSKLYGEVLTDIVENIDKVALSPSPLSALIRLRQCTGYTGILSTDIQESAKLDRMNELVEDIVASGEKCIVFSNWTQITDEVQVRLKKYNPVTITGNTSESDREIAKKKFQEDDNCKVIIGTIGAMGTGLTLTAATHVIFLDHPWTRALYDQAVDRAHRIGQKSTVVIHNIMAKDTLDMRVYDIVVKKGLVSDLMLDNPEALNKTQMLNFLLG